MRTTKLQRGEIEIKSWLQFLPVPRIGPDELLVICALLIPIRQERTGEIETLPIPALRHHVDLLPDLLLINLLRLLRISDIENATLAVPEAADKQSFVIGTQTNID